MKNTDLITLTPSAALQAFSNPSETQKIINDVRIKAEEFKKDQDLSTDKGRKQIASDAHKISKMKARLLELKLSSTKSLRETVKAVNESGNLIGVELDALRDDVRKPLTDFEDAEKERIAEHTLSFVAIQLCGEEYIDGQKLTLEELRNNLEKLEKNHVDKSFEEFEFEALKAHQKSLASVTQLIANEEKRIKEEAELEQLRQDKIKREAKEKQEKHNLKIKHEAEQKALEKSELARKEQEEIQRQTEQDKQDAIQREKQAKQDLADAEEKIKTDAIQAEADKKALVRKTKADEKLKADAKKFREREAKEKLENDKAHTATIHTQIKTALINKCGIQGLIAIKVVEAIANGQIPNVKINY